MTRLKRHTDLPVAVGFGIRNAGAGRRRRQGRRRARWSARPWSSSVAAHLDSEGRAKASLPGALLGLVRELADGVRRSKSA